MKHIEGISKFIGVLICLTFIVSPGLPIALEFLIFGVILTTVGIPHGAIDHLIHNPQIDRKGLIRFILIYLLLILIYGLTWWLLPKLALGAFLVMSAYHFGQSHFIGKPVPKKLAYLPMILKGSFFLSVILFGSWDQTRKIIQPILEINFSTSVQLFIIIFFLLSSIGIELILKLKLSIEHYIEYLILAPILYFSPLLLGFIIYFGFWHALPSMMEEFRFLKTIPTFKSPLKFGIQLLPFSLISMVGIALLIIVGVNYLEENQLYLLFFILISLISFPHILYMDAFLKKNYKY
jgi:beta-carotene 15,15'-dioxygenase